jgi:hypothetical protein
MESENKDKEGVEETIVFRCGKDLKQRFLDRAKGLQLKPSNLARLVFEKAFPRSAKRTLEEDEAGAKPAMIDKTVVEKKDQRLTVWLTKAELEAVKERAAVMGRMGHSEWTMRLIRISLSKTPQLNREEVKALREAIRELSYIGRNLNQVAHALNVDLNEKDRVTAELISSIHKQVEEVRGRAKAVMDENVYRWGIF